MKDSYGNSKLTPELVKMVRKMIHEGCFYSEVREMLSRDFGIELTRHAVYDIARHRTWRNL